MKIKFKKTFLKELSKLPTEIREKVGNLVFKDILEISSLKEIKGVKKIKGYKSFYRIKIDDYRIGFELKKDGLIFYRIKHRKDIYKYFP